MCEENKNLPEFPEGSLILAFETAAAAENALPAVKAAFRGTACENWMRELIVSDRYIMTYADYVGEEAYSFPIPLADTFGLVRRVGLAAAGAAPDVPFAGKAQFYGKGTPNRKSFVYAPADRTLCVKDGTEPIRCDCDAVVAFDASGACLWQAAACPRCGRKLRLYAPERDQPEEYKLQ